MFPTLNLSLILNSVTSQTPVGEIGLQICFDFWYPELALSMKRQGAHIITYPSAFIVPTGKVPRELLLRARAVETQSYGENSRKRSVYSFSFPV